MTDPMLDYYRQFGTFLDKLTDSMTKRPTPSLDPRDPDPSRPGIFRDHNCWKCKDGAQPCRTGNPLQCEYPHARND